MNNSRILITGAGGFVGIHLAKILSAKNNFITGLMLESQKNKYLDKTIFCDITNMEDLIKIKTLDFDYIFHLAAHTNIKEGILNPRNDLEINFLGTFNLIEIFRNKTIKSFNFISSVSVLSSKNKLPLAENATYGPSTPYAASKMSAEAYLKAYSKCFNLPIKIIRLFNVYGPGRSGLVVDDFINKLLVNNKTLEIMGDGKQIRDFLYVSDAVSGIILVAQDGEVNNTYNVASGIPIEINELAKKIIYFKTKNVQIKRTKKNYGGEFFKMVCRYF